MPNQFFKFKQFTILQDKCAMKVGTDGTLLGAWTDVSKHKKILDVGTGTGLIALMIAQRNKDAFIDAIDIDADAYIQATENVKNSPFSKQIQVHHTSFQSFIKNPCKSSYDLIVSNPPYFSNSLKGPEKKRNLARHSDTLPLDEFIHLSSSLLADNGHIALILPFQRKEELFNLIDKNKLNNVRQTNIIPTLGAQPKRLLIELSFLNISLTTEELTLEQSRGQRTKAYQKIMQEFYL